MYEIETGIDTFSFHHVLTPSQRVKILERLKRLPGFYTEVCSYPENTYIYYCDWFA